MNDRQDAAYPSSMTYESNLTLTPSAFQHDTLRFHSRQRPDASFGWARDQELAVAWQRMLTAFDVKESVIGNTKGEIQTISTASTDVTSALLLQRCDS